MTLYKDCRHTVLAASCSLLTYPILNAICQFDSMCQNGYRLALSPGLPELVPRLSRSLLPLLETCRVTMVLLSLNLSCRQALCQPLSKWLLHPAQCNLCTTPTALIPFALLPVTPSAWRAANAVCWGSQLGTAMQYHPQHCASPLWVLCEFDYLTFCC